MLSDPNTVTSQCAAWEPLSRLLHVAAADDEMYMRTTLGLWVTAILLGASCATDTAMAAPPTDDAVKTAIRAANPDSDIDGFQRVYGGTLGMQKEVTIAIYTTVPSGGGNITATNFGVFVRREGIVAQLLNEPEPAGQIRSVAIHGRHLLATWMSYRPDDPRCCPSERHTASYMVGYNAVVQGR